MKAAVSLPAGLRLAGSDEAGWYFLTGLESPRSVWVTDVPERVIPDDVGFGDATFGLVPIEFDEEYRGVGPDRYPSPGGAR